MRFLEKRREWSLSGLFYSDDLVLCGESEENLKVMMGRFVELCRRRGLKVTADKSKVMALGGEEGLKCEIRVNRARLEQVSEFKYEYLGCVLDESSKTVAECRTSKFAGVIRSLANAWGL